MSGAGNCVFNSEWFVDKLYKDCLQNVKADKHAAYCKLCCRILGPERHEHFKG